MYFSVCVCCVLCVWTNDNIARTAQVMGTKNIRTRTRRSLKSSHVNWSSREMSDWPEVTEPPSDIASKLLYDSLSLAQSQENTSKRNQRQRIKNSPQKLPINSINMKTKRREENVHTFRFEKYHTWEDNLVLGKTDPKSRKCIRI